MANAPKYFGLIIQDEDEISCQSPRIIDGDEFDSPQKALRRAVEIVAAGERRPIEVVEAKLYGPDGDGYWGEVPGAGSITIDASSAVWFADPEDE